MTRMHLDATPEGSPLPIAACGRMTRYGETTNVRELVTCKVCMLRVAEQACETIKQAADMLMSTPAPGPRMRLVVPESDPAEPPLCVVTPERWEQQRCRCGRCDTCVWYKPFEALAESGDGGREELCDPHDEKPRWSSVKSALAWYKRYLESGYTLESLLGGLVRSEEGGTPRSFGPRTERRDSLLVRVAQDTAMFSLVIREAHARTETHGLDIANWITVILARVIGKWTHDEKTRRGRRYPKAEVMPAEHVAECVGISEAAVGVLVTNGVRVLTVELAARRLVAARRAERELEVEIEMRRAELARRRAG